MGNEVSGNVSGLVLQVESVGTLNIHPPPALPTALDGLPTGSGEFVGRLAELERLAAGTGVTLVHGLGGVGKTELLLRYAERADFPGGRLHLDLRGYDPDGAMASTDALSSLLHMLGLDSPPGEAARAALFRTAMAKRDHALLLLDNASSTSQVRPLLVPRHRVVVSSRNTLASLTAERLELGVLSLPEAVELVGDEEIATLCGRLPLALRIMAALIESDPENDWAAELREVGLDVLDDGDDRAVHAAFRLSYDALGPDQRRLFRLLAVHPGDIDVPSTAALADLPPSRARKLLADLRAAHLLERDNRFHDLVRQYALRCLIDEGTFESEQTAVLLRLAVYYPQAGIERAQGIRNNHCDPIALAWMDRNYNMVLLMAQLMHMQGQNAVPVVNSLYYYFSLRKQLGPWIQSQQMAVESARRSHDRQVLARELNRLGAALRHARRFDEALALGEEALRLNEEASDQIGIGSALIALAATYRHMGRPERSLLCCERSLRIRLEVGDQYGLGITLTNLGATQLALGNPDLAITHYREALELQRSRGFEGSVAITLHDLGKAHHAKGDLDPAVESFQAALRIHRHRDDRFHAGVTLKDLGVVYRELGRTAEADEAFRDALKAFEEVDDKYDAHLVRELLTR